MQGENDFRIESAINAVPYLISDFLERNRNQKEPFVSMSDFFVLPGKNRHDGDRRRKNGQCQQVGCSEKFEWPDDLRILAENFCYAHLCVSFGFVKVIA